MSKRHQFTEGIVLTLALCLLIPFTGLAGDQQGPSEEEIAAWMAAISPGEEHQQLDAMVGSWDATIKSWESPDQPEPMVSAGTSEMQWILGGRYLEQRYSGSFMGMPFEGLGYIGYDKAAGHYVSVWMDNFSTGMMSETGSYDAEAKQFETKGSYLDPMTKQKSATRSVHRLEGPDKSIIEMYMTGPDGNEFKMMEIVYTRK